MKMGGRNYLKSKICPECNNKVYCCDECSKAIEEMQIMFCDEEIFHFCSKNCWCKHTRRRKWPTDLNPISANSAEQ